MASNSSHPVPSTLKAQIELRLLQNLLHNEQSYPWNPDDLEAESYFSELEQEMMDLYSSDEIADQAQRFSVTLEQAWAQVLPVVEQQETVVAALRAKLSQGFSIQVPEDLLQKIVQKAQESLAANVSLAEQLVQCVQSVLPGWGSDDLQVLARPYAFAMRGTDTDTIEVALRSVRCAAWTELSGVEQARLSLAIARYTLDQIPSSASAPE